MAIGKTVNFRGLTVSGAYIRLDAVSGSKQHGWNGLFNIYVNATQANPPKPVVKEGEPEQPAPAPVALDNFHVRADFNATLTPHSQLYAAAKEFLGDGCTDV